MLSTEEKKEIFSKWFNQKFLEWRNNQEDRKANVTLFAKFLRIIQPSVSQYLNGDAVPEGENLFRTATKLGFEIYELLEYDRPDFVKELREYYDIPEEMRSTAMEVLKKWKKDKGLE